MALVILWNMKTSLMLKAFSPCWYHPRDRLLPNFSSVSAHISGSLQCPFRLTISAPPANTTRQQTVTLNPVFLYHSLHPICDFQKLIASVCFPHQDVRDLWEQVYFLFAAYNPHLARLAENRCIINTCWKNEWIKHMRKLA